MLEKDLMNKIKTTLSTEMKRLLFLFLLLVACLLSAQAQTFTYNNSSYRVLDEDLKTCMMTSFSTAGSITGEITLPSKVVYDREEYTVTVIGSSCFFEKTGLTKVVLPNNLKIIQIEAFAGCENLTSIIIPNTVIEIYNRAFQNCIRLNSLTLGESLQTIGPSAFAGCEGLKTVRIPDNVTAIGDGAFSGCAELKSAILGKSIEAVSGSVFSECDRLVKVAIPSTYPGNPFGPSDHYVHTYNQDAVIENDVIYNANKTELIYAPASLLSTFKIPNTVTKIAEQAFAHCCELNSIIIPGSVNSIGNECFIDCPQLTHLVVDDGDEVLSIGSQVFDNTPLKMLTMGRNWTRSDDLRDNFPSTIDDVTLGTNVTQIPDRAFQNLNSLKSITIPDRVASIGDYAFGECRSLNNIVIPNSVIKIGKGAFFRCEGLTSARIGDSVTDIGDELFNDCANLTSVILGNSMDSISYDCFSNCEKLESIVLPNSIKNIARSSFSRCTSLKNITLNQGLKKISDNSFSGCTSLASIEIPSSVDEIGEFAFAICSALKTISIPNGVKELKKGVFYMSGLESINLPRSIETIGMYAFVGCAALKSIILPDSLKSLGEYAFTHCPALEEVVFPPLLTSISQNTFEDSANLRKVAYPKTMTHSISTLIRIEYDPANVKIEDGFVYDLHKESIIYAPISFSGTLIVPAIVKRIGRLAFAECSDLSSVVIPASVDSICDGAFYNCSSLQSLIVEDSEKTLAFGNSVLMNAPIDAMSLGRNWTAPGVLSDCVSTVLLGSKVTLIPNNAFSYCKSLLEIEIPTSVKWIGDEAFTNCVSLTSINIPDSVKSIGASAFEMCQVLQTAVIGNAVESIGEKIFNGADKLSSVKLGNALRYIPADAFFGCRNLLSISIPDSVRIIGNAAFKGCTKLSNVTFGASVDSIKTEAFYNCLGLNAVSFPEKMVSIGDFAFSQCLNLKNIQLPDSLREIGKNAFSSCGELASLTLPDSLEIIGEEAFSGCSIIRSVILPPMLRSLGTDAFSQCQSLKKVAVPQTICDPNFDILGARIIQYNPEDVKIEEGVVYNGDKTKLLFASLDFAGDCRIGETVEVIAPYAFEFCNDIESLHIPNSVKEIQASAFSLCGKLKSAYIGNGVHAIGEDAFVGAAMETVVLPPSLRKLGSRAFAYNTQLQTVAMGHRVDTIGSQVFLESSVAHLYITAKTPPSIPADAFNDNIANLYLQGENSMERYAAAHAGWQKFTAHNQMIEADSLTLIPPTSLPQKAGENFKLTATLSSEGASLPYVYWRSTNPSLAKVNHEGVVTLQKDIADIKKEECEIIAETLYADGPMAVYNLGKVGVTQLKLDPTSWNGYTGETFRISATISPESATEKRIKWESTDNAIAMVDSIGNVKTLKAGQCKIIATTTDGSALTAECVVTVSAKLITALSVDPAAWNGVKNSSFKIEARVEPQDADCKTLRWSSTNEQIAVVDSIGNVKTLKAGQCKIIATTTDGSALTAECVVTVSPKLITSLSIDPATWNGVEGTSFKIEARVEPQDADCKTLRWSSTNEQIAVVDSIGEVKVLKAGNCVIKVETTDDSNLIAECVITSASGIDEIFNEGDEFMLFTLQGILLKQNALREDLKALSSGVYIIRQGNKTKKIIIR